MKIRDIIQENVPPTTTPGAVAQAPAPVAAVDATAEAEPTPQDIKQIQDLIGTIDPQKEQPQSLVNKLTSWIRQYPLLDKVTDLIPQTRIVKAIANAVDALEKGDAKTALNAVAGAVGGGVAQAARAVNVGSALAQGDVTQAALAAGGKTALAAKGVNAAQALAGGNALQAVGQFAPGAAKAATTAQALAKGDTTVDGELSRIKSLAGVNTNKDTTNQYGA